ncbi:hypothetical protein NG796_20750 [Laspinema sp. A4]|uniref:hypothetical protein n=1 Tax=Laspinema sp. D2d TaxID=2953686 RepID=UPI0021BB4027|nr:hypothetical protein [Laspinema sp. D2d]MCT7985706.1 hypothetical protein [Laspinema sp. D2d]
MLIYLTFNCTSGPLPLARGGLGWGPHCRAIARHEKIGGTSLSTIAIASKSA